MLMRHTHRLLILIFSLTMVACSSNKVVKTYDGKALANESIAVLNAPENITVLSVNGKDVQQYLLSNLNVNYGLKPGENLVVFKYESIWSKAKRDEESGSRVDIVESEPLEVLIKARAGVDYHFNFLPAKNVREAKELAAAFSAQILDENKGLVAESVALNTYLNEKESVAQQEEKLYQENKVAENNQSKAEDKTVLDSLKEIWPTASADEKKAFLVWVFQ